MAALAALFAVLGIGAVTAACRTGSAAVLMVGLVDVGIGLVAFCCWAWTL